MSPRDVNEMHWLMGVVHSIDVGIVVIDRGFQIRLWNDFMENRSGRRADAVMGRNIFNLFPELPQKWLERKINSVTTLANRSFTTWEQRPYLFKFKNNRPITGKSEYMYQNITFIPLTDTSGEIGQIAIVIYDATETAIGKQELESANDELAKLSRIDRLSGLNNRGYWEECLQSEFDRFKRTGQPVSLLMFDIDHFKKVNDSYGHQAGDEVIRQTAKILRKSIRKTDIAGRYGGEEFVVLLIDTECENATLFAERLRKNIADSTVTYDSEDIKYSVSLGLTQLGRDVRDYTQWLEQADQALYYSKEHGRNRLTVFDRMNAAVSLKDVGGKSQNGA